MFSADLVVYLLLSVIVMFAVSLLWLEHKIDKNEKEVDGKLVKAITYIYGQVEEYVQGRLVATIELHERLKHQKRDAKGHYQPLERRDILSPLTHVDGETRRGRG